MKDSNFPIHWKSYSGNDNKEDKASHSEESGKARKNPQPRRNHEN